MKIKLNIFVVLIMASFAASIAPIAQADTASNREYQIKGAFLYNFIKFVDWPEEKRPESDNTITIGIIGKDPFGNAFEPIKDKLVKGKKVIVKRFKGLVELEKSGEKNKSEEHQQIDSIKKCHLLFICSSEKTKLNETINMVKDHNVLTVADTRNFLESGGIINFVMEEKKVRFEINIATAKQAKLEIRSQLLRLAKRILEEKQSDEAKN